MIAKYHLNTEQFSYAIVEAGYGLLIAAIVAFSGYFSGAINGAGLGVALLAALSVALKRVHEGWQDGIRNEKGEVQSQDVGAFLPPLEK